MSLELLGLVGLLVMLVLMGIGVPIAFAMGLVGFLGMAYISGWPGAFDILGQTPYSISANYTLSIIPLFVLMGELIYSSGISEDLFDASSKWFGHWRGGLGIATIMGCAGFSAVCGSSVATAMTMGTIAIPELRKHGYNPALATGCVAAGGTLGILIPPSSAFVIYGMLTNVSVSKLLMSGWLPGLMLMGLFIITTTVLCFFNPKLGPSGIKFTWRERFISLKRIWTILLLILIISGGMYSGVFTPNEAAAIGVAVAFILTLVLRKFSWSNTLYALRMSATSAAMLLTIVIGAMMLNYFFTATRLPYVLGDYIANMNVPIFVLVAVIVIVHIILGCVMDSMAVIIVLVPIIFPTIIALGIDPIWYGVLTVILVEQGLITPPVGVNVFVIKGVAKDVPLSTIFRGVLPYFTAMIVSVVLLTAFPSIATFVATTMK